MKKTVRQHSIFMVLVASIAFSSFVNASEATLNKNVQSLEAIVASYYNVVSGPKGFKYDAKADNFLHAPEAMITRFNENNDFQRHDLPKEQESLREPYVEGFYEVEIHRLTEEYENVAHVWSTYEMRNSPESTPFMRGVNSISFYFNSGRWFISSWSTQYEGANKIPAKYLPQNQLTSQFSETPTAPTD